MSLASWKREFYPIKASKATGTNLQALCHCLRKWKGLLPENLQKHGLCKPELADYIVPSNIEAEDELPEDIFSIDSDTCALCQRSFDDHSGCEDCALAKSFRLRQHRASDHTPCNHNHAYATWSLKDNPKPMIRDLEHAIEDLRKRRIK